MSVCLVKPALSYYRFDLHKILIMVGFQSMLVSRGQREKKLISGKFGMEAGNLLKDTFLSLKGSLQQSLFQTIYSTFTRLSIFENVLLPYRSDIPTFAVKQQRGSLEH